MSDSHLDVAAHGADHPGETPAAGLLGHDRAQLALLDGVLDRNPRLMAETCASDGTRMDHAPLSRPQPQSTSDQQDVLRYAPTTTHLTAWRRPGGRGRGRHDVAEQAGLIGAAPLTLLHRRRQLRKADRADRKA
ncbi:hypothetical protein ACFZB9_07030 [Kitasatospora sp. NPDC008050]|uniref:hypothetical protein n=1 Tax=Kitasatospora sp. NPDC008050 TaxID=3364021 RepID=UPI0036EA6676